MATEKIGLKAIFETPEFTAGLNKYLAGLRMTEQRTGATAGALSSLGSVATVALGNALSTIATSTIPRLVGSFENLIGSSIMTAARTQELNLVLGNLARLFNLSQAAVDNAVQSIVDYGIRTDVAQKLTAQFIRFNLDLSKATDLARVAQDAAVLSMKDSSDTLDGLLTAILTYNNRIARTNGINVTAEQAFRKFADAQGISTDAMTQQQRAAAFLNAILEEGTRITGTYETAMQSASKQVRSLSRHIFEIKNEAGEPFQEAFLTAVNVVTQLTKVIQTAVSEGGSLRPLLEAMGASASVAADGLQDLVNRLLGVDPAVQALKKDLPGLASAADRAAMDMSAAGDDIQREFVDRLMATADSALTWGVNIASQLAIGLITGAAQSITAAMDFISGLLAHWLAPGSPPLVAPKIDQWGSGAFGEYLKGFTKADFGILKSLQGPLRQALSLLVQKGALSREEMGNTFANLSTGISRAIAQFEKTGAFDPAIYDRLKKAAGGFGAEMAELLQRQIGLAKATQEAERAQEALNDANAANQTARNRVRALVQEYNQLIRAGASDEILRAKLAEINAADENVIATEAQKKQAEKAAQAAQDQLDPLKEQVALQRDLLQSLLDIAQAQAQISLPTPGGAGGGGGLPEPGAGGGFGAGAVGGVTDAIESAFEEMKNRIREKLQTLFAPIVEQWQADVQPALDELSAAWKNFTGLVKKFWDEKAGPVFEKLGLAITPEVLANFGRLIGGALGAAAAFGLMLAAITILTSPLALLTGALFLLATVWTNMGEAAVTAATQLAILVVAIVLRVKHDVVEAFETMRSEVVAKFNALRDKASEITEAIKGFFTETDWGALGKGIVDGIKQGIKNNLQALLDVVIGMADSIIALIKSILGIGSPSKVMKRLAEFTLEGFEQGLEARAKMVQQTMAGTMQMAITPAMIPAAITNSSQRVVQLNMQNNINSGLDQVAFESRVLQVINQALGY